MRKAVWLSALALVTACSGASDIIATDTPEQRAATPLISTLYSNVPDRRRLLITDEQSWSRLWAEMVGSGGAVSAPRVDFAKDNVLVAAMGEKHEAGYRIDISSVESSNGILRVIISNIVPTPGCSGADVITTPLAAVIIPRTSSAISFIEKGIVIPCP